MDNQGLIEKVVEFVKKELEGAEAGHDWWHIERVWKNTQLLLKSETDADPLTCQLAALLHDIADSKFHNGDETIGPRISGDFLASLDVDPVLIKHVCAIIAQLSYSTSLGEISFHSKELEVVQDADRLDAIGAIGIARAFHYGGFKNRELYNPAIKAYPFQDKETYKKNTSSTLNHFHEKLFLLTAKMNTETAKKIAQKRHHYMEDFVLQFLQEWHADDHYSEN